MFLDTERKCIGAAQRKCIAGTLPVLTATLKLPHAGPVAGALTAWSKNGYRRSFTSARQVPFTGRSFSAYVFSCFCSSPSGIR